jgi:hypothetical protein
MQALTAAISSSCGVAALDALAAKGEAVDGRLAAGLASPAGGHIEGDLGELGIGLDRLDGLAERGKVEAVDAAFYGIQHHHSPLK